MAIITSNQSLIRRRAINGLIITGTTAIAASVTSGVANVAANLAPSFIPQHTDVQGLCHRMSSASCEVRRFAVWIAATLGLVYATNAPRSYPSIPDKIEQIPRAFVPQIMEQLSDEDKLAIFRAYPDHPNVKRAAAPALARLHLNRILQFIRVSKAILKGTVEGAVDSGMFTALIKQSFIINVLLNAIGIYQRPEEDKFAATKLALNMLISTVLRQLFRKFAPSIINSVIGRTCVTFGALNTVLSLHMLSTACKIPYTTSAIMRSLALQMRRAFVEGAIAGGSVAFAGNLLTAPLCEKYQVSPVNKSKIAIFLRNINALMIATLFFRAERYHLNPRYTQVNSKFGC